MKNLKVDQESLEFIKHEIGSLTMSPFEMFLDTDIVYHKNKPTLNAYKWLFSIYGTPESVFEIGIKNGGSLVLWDRVFNKKTKNTKIAGIDININQVSTAAKNYCDLNNINIYECDCLDANKLNNITQTVFEDSIDMVIDDGAHNLETILPSLSNLWPKLKNGGIYVIEDWSIIDRAGKQILFDNLFNLLIQDWQNNDTSNYFPFFIHVHRNFIAIVKK